MPPGMVAGGTVNYNEAMNATSPPDAALLLRLLDSAPAMLGYWNTSLRCCFSNAAYSDWFGKSREQMRGIAMRDALGPVFDQNIAQITGALQGKFQQFERAVVVADGSLRHSIMTYTPDVQQGVVAGFFVHVADVTRLKQTEQHLREAQAELAAMVRARERLRIARDLHDTLGHHLTALNLQLEVALADLGSEVASLRISRQLAQQLLSEVRAVVSQERALGEDDLGRALTELCRMMPAPQVELHLGAGLDQVDQERGRVACYVVREAVTNAARHARAQKIVIFVANNGRELTILAQDDGAADSRAATEGNGLKGMRERVEALHGVLGAGPALPAGWAVRVTLPAPP